MFAVTVTICNDLPVIRLHRECSPRCSSTKKTLAGATSQVKIIAEAPWCSQSKTNCRFLLGFQVGFVAGSNGLPLPAQYLNALDSVLIPVIHSRGRKRGDEPIVMEFIFYILENIT